MRIFLRFLRYLILDARAYLRETWSWAILGKGEVGSDESESESESDVKELGGWSEAKIREVVKVDMADSQRVELRARAKEVADELGRKFPSKLVIPSYIVPRDLRDN